MNYVGKMLYSVATPFHPFGGAVDIIVVQQQDGTYRTTPWYVRFGKFQGVLKGSEKCVRINVNGVEADFHMYLDAAGEAYFSREIVLDQEGEGNGDVKIVESSEEGIIYDDKGDNLNKGSYDRLQSAASDPGVACDAYTLLRPSRLDRSESDAVFYDFQDDQSSLDGSVDLSSEYGSSNYMEPQGSNAEMVLVSVDGHILTAPISSSEQDNENVTLDTPQFHLGPAQSSEFCEGNAGFSVTDRDWATGFVSNLEASSSYKAKKVHLKGSSCKGDSVNGRWIDNNSTLEEQPNVRGCEAAGGPHQDSTAELEVSGEDERCAEQQCIEVNLQGVSETDEKSLHHDPVADDAVSDTDDVHSNIDEASVSSKDEDLFSSCLKLSDFSSHASNGDMLGEISTSKIHQDEDAAEENLSGNFQRSSFDFETPQRNDSTNIPTNGEGERKIAGDVIKGLASSLSTTTNSSVTLDSDKELRSEKDTSSYVQPSHSDHAMLSNNTNSKDVHIVSSCSAESIEITECKDYLETESSRKEENVEPQSTGVQADLGSGFDISICRDLLHPGMGFNAAAEAFDQHRISQVEFKDSYASIIKNENLVVRIGECYFTWEKAAPIVLGKVVFGLDLPVEQTDVISVEQYESNKSEENDTLNPSTPRYWLWRNPFRRSRTLQPSSSTLSNEDVFLDSESSSHSSPMKSTPTLQGASPLSVNSSKAPRKKILRTNIPTSKQIASLNLKDGQNMVTFSFNTRVWGEQKVDAHIYLWKWNARIVISDVDGTITKSDVLGQFMPLVGRDWTQSGVARLFCAIKENGYQLLFLSARAIVQAYLTRSFLLNLKQDGKTMPNGPVVISPDGLFPSLYREVIRRAPHEFKIACLEDIKALFPPDYNPFYAGFGNRDTDELSYRKIGIPKGKIFIINPKGEVAVSHRIDVKSYTNLHTLVNDMFPPTSMIEQEDYNAWNYWRVPLPDVED